MKIKAITIEGHKGDVQIHANDKGAFVIHGLLCIAAFDRREPGEARYPKALEVAKAVFGTDRQGRANATNSMVHEVIDAIERVAGC